PGPGEREQQKGAERAGGASPAVDLHGARLLFETDEHQCWLKRQNTDNTDGHGKRTPQASEVGLSCFSHRVLSRSISRRLSEGHELSARRPPTAYQPDVRANALTDPVGRSQACKCAICA